MNNENNPRVDILLSTYNGEEFIHQQIESLFEQTYQNWRLIVRDDGSTDGTLDIVRQYIKDYPEQIILHEIVGGNLGPCQSFSVLLAQCTAGYIMFCDQDDVWLPNKIYAFMAKMLVVENETGNALAVLVHSDLIVVDENLKPVAKSLWKHQGLLPRKMEKIENLLIQNHVTGCATMINRRLADLSSPIPAGVIMHDWWLALVAITCGRLVAIPDATIKYRQHGNNDVGAKRWGVVYILKSIAMIPAMYGGFNITAVQAQGLLMLEDNFLDKKTFNTVQSYIELFGKHWLAKKIAAMRLGIFKYGRIRNVAMLLFI